ncbi:MAG: hypothetical protein CMJ58_04285 [Planctomycetaceae bacterium]|nr:hypothetical protein [Planctomycetaceae bacterium]
MIRSCVFAAATLLLLCPHVRGDLYTGNGNSGFGGAVGGGSLEITNDLTNLYFSFSRGGGNLNDALVLYIDAASGGFADTSSFTDTADALRTAITGGGSGGSVVTFAGGMQADYAIALDAGFAGLWSLSTGSHGFQNSAGLSPTGDPSAPTHTFSTSLASLGLSPGSTISFVGTYISGSAFRSDEAFGDGISSGNPGFTGDVTFTSFNRYTVAVPEASSFLFGGLVAGAVVLSRRRRLGRG